MALGINWNISNPSFCFVIFFFASWMTILSSTTSLLLHCLFNSSRLEHPKSKVSGWSFAVATQTRTSFIWEYGMLHSEWSCWRHAGVYDPPWHWMVVITTFLSAGCIPCQNAGSSANFCWGDVLISSSLNSSPARRNLRIFLHQSGNDNLVLGSRFTRRNDNTQVSGFSCRTIRMPHVRRSYWSRCVLPVKLFITLRCSNSDVAAFFLSVFAVSWSYPWLTWDVAWKSHRSWSSVSSSSCASFVAVVVLMGGLE